MAELHDGLNQVVHAGIVRLREQTAVRINGQCAAEFDPSVFNERSTFAFLAEARRLNLQNGLPVKQS